jgi:hypothetical protein
MLLNRLSLWLRLRRGYEGMRWRMVGMKVRRGEEGKNSKLKN